MIDYDAFFSSLLVKLKDRKPNAASDWSVGSGRRNRTRGTNMSKAVVPLTTAEFFRSYSVTGSWWAVRKKKNKKTAMRQTKKAVGASRIRPFESRCGPVF